MGHRAQRLELLLYDPCSQPNKASFFCFHEHPLCASSGMDAVATHRSASKALAKAHTASFCSFGCLKGTLPCPSPMPSCELRSKDRCRARGHGRPTNQALLFPSGSLQLQALHPESFFEDLPGEPHPHGDDLDSGGLWRCPVLASGSGAATFLLESFRSIV